MHKQVLLPRTEGPGDKANKYAYFWSYIRVCMSISVDTALKV